MLEQGSGGCCRIRASAADGRDARVRFDHVALSADEEGLALVGDQKQGFQRAQHLVGAPVLGQLDGGAAQVAVILLQLRLEASEQREGVGGGTGKAGEDLVLIQAANLAGRVLNDAFPEGDLAVSGHNHFSIPANAKNRSRADQTLACHELVDYNSLKRGPDGVERG